MRTVILGPLNFRLRDQMIGRQDKRNGRSETAPDPRRAGFSMPTRCISHIPVGSSEGRSPSGQATGCGKVACVFALLERYLSYEVRLVGVPRAFCLRAII